ncbi:hypothetical protein ANN_13151 [Periplaneta americana]|uniref:FP protein C-terminal domain-containing protein n=1 Tax=Periplaneta americana TaxID=6978 RepID=A0ABQ8TIR6_PERAM|nr:hypothetical protein ANN_13151 [Periplaneta americana]
MFCKVESKKESDGPGISLQRLPNHVGLGRFTVADHLTVATRDLLRKIRDIAKMKGYKFVWAKDCNIIVCENESSPVYGREAVSRKCVYEWFERFREGKETIEDEPRSGPPSTSRTPEMIEKVRQMLAQDRRLTLRLIAEELDISKDAIVRDDLGKRKICSRFVPHKLIDE